MENLGTRERLWGIMRRLQNRAHFAIVLVTGTTGWGGWMVVFGRFGAKALPLEKFRNHDCENEERLLLYSFWPGEQQ